MVSPHQLLTILLVLFVTGVGTTTIPNGDRRTLGATNGFNSMTSSDAAASVSTALHLAQTSLRLSTEPGLKAVWPEWVFRNLTVCVQDPKGLLGRETRDFSPLVSSQHLDRIVWRDERSGASGSHRTSRWKAFHLAAEFAIEAWESACGVKFHLIPSDSCLAPLDFQDGERDDKDDDLHRPRVPAWFTIEPTSFTKTAIGRKVGDAPVLNLLKKWRGGVWGSPVEPLSADDDVVWRVSAHSRKEKDDNDSTNSKRNNNSRSRLLRSTMLMPRSERMDAKVRIDDRQPFPSLLKTMIHELGHALGFAHEFIDQDDDIEGDTITLTAFDDRSVMGYGAEPLFPSPLDVIGASSVYGGPSRVNSVKIWRMRDGTNSNNPSNVDGATGVQQGAGKATVFGMEHTLVDVVLEGHSAAYTELSVSISVGDDAEQSDWDSKEKICRKSGPAYARALLKWFQENGVSHIRCDGRPTCTMIFLDVRVAPAGDDAENAQVDRGRMKRNAIVCGNSEMMHIEVSGRLLEVTRSGTQKSGLPAAGFIFPVMVVAPPSLGAVGVDANATSTTPSSPSPSPSPLPPLSVVLKAIVPSKGPTVTFENVEWTSLVADATSNSSGDTGDIFSFTGGQFNHALDALKRREKPPRSVILTHVTTFPTSWDSLWTLLGDVTTRLEVVGGDMTEMLLTTKMLKNIKTLQISRGNLRDIDSGLSLEPAVIPLEVLDLSHNQLSSIPAFVTAAPHLQVLKVSNNRLSSLPSKVGSSVLKEVLLSGNALKNNPFNDAKWLMTSKHLDLSGNLIGQADIPAVGNNNNNNNNTRLQSLDLGMNVLRTLPTFSMEIARRLRRLNLGGNWISGSVSVPDYLHSLVSLDLSQNNIGNVDVGAAGASAPTQLALEELDVRGNEIGTLHESFFVSLPNLQRLLADSNELVSLPKSMCKHASLRILSVTRNQLQRVTCVPPSTVDLYLSHNQIGEFSADMSHKLDQLTNLWVDHNKLSSFPLGIGSSSGPKKFHTIALSHNKISRVPPEVSLVRCKHVHLSHNFITYIPPLRENGYQTLDLSHNLIEKVAGQVISAYLFDISHNPNINNHTFKDVTVISTHIIAAHAPNVLQSLNPITNHFDLSYSSISHIDISWLGWHVILRGNPITTLSCLGSGVQSVMGQMEALSSLDLRDTALQYPPFSYHNLDVEYDTVESQNRCLASAIVDLEVLLTANSGEFQRWIQEANSRNREALEGGDGGDVHAGAQESDRSPPPAMMFKWRVLEMQNDSFVGCQHNGLPGFGHGIRVGHDGGNPIPDYVFGYSNLRRLSLCDTDLPPEPVAAWSKLEYVRISLFQGHSIPSWLLQLPRLRELTISCNVRTQGHCQFPPNVANHNLRRLRASHVSVDGTDWDKRFPNLERLELRDSKLRDLRVGEKIVKLTIRESNVRTIRLGHKSQLMTTVIEDAPQLSVVECFCAASMVSFIASNVPNLTLPECQTMTTPDGPLALDKKNYRQTNLKSVSIRNCKLTRIPWVMGSSPHLEDIALSENFIDSLPPLLSTPRFLDISSNRLTSLPLHLYNETVKLMMGGNPIELPKNYTIGGPHNSWLFEHVAGSFFDFDYASMNLTAIPNVHNTCWLGSKVFLNNNRIRSLAAGGDLSLCSGVAEIDLSHNQINDPDMTEYLPEGLHSLSLGWNNLTKFPVLHRQRKLKYLGLEGNSLTSLPTTLLARMRSLKHLSVAHNKLTEVNVPMTTRLWLLDASFNELKQIPRKFPSSMKKLIIGHNCIDSIGELDPVAWAQANLREVDISYNNITHIPSDAGYVFHKVAVLVISGNRIKTGAGSLAYPFAVVSDGSWSDIDPSDITPQMFHKSGLLLCPDDQSKLQECRRGSAQLVRRANVETLATAFWTESFAVASELVIAPPREFGNASLAELLEYQHKEESRGRSFPTVMSTHSSDHKFEFGIYDPHSPRNIYGSRNIQRYFGFPDTKVEVRGRGGPLHGSFLTRKHASVKVKKAKLDQTDDYRVVLSRALNDTTFESTMGLFDTKFALIGTEGPCDGAGRVAGSGGGTDCISVLCDPGCRIKMWVVKPDDLGGHFDVKAFTLLGTAIFIPYKIECEFCHFS